MFNKDILLNDEAFDKAVEDFKALSVSLQELRGKVESMMKTLETGFNTPAGRKFIRSCQDNLFQPLDDQKLVLEHICESLESVKDTYAPVFTEYDELTKSINRVEDF